MDAHKAADELKVIRELMERPVRYSTASGLSGIVAGLAALAGAAFDKYLTPRIAEHFADVVEPSSVVDWEFLLRATVWAVVFCVAFGGVVVLTRVRERRQGMPFWSSIKWRILRTIAVPFIATVGLTGAIYCQWFGLYNFTQVNVIPAVWMLFYGVAVWQVGEFSIAEIRLLGMAFVLAGIATAAVGQDYPHECLGASFGGFHIVYGAVVWMRHGG